MTTYSDRQDDKAKREAYREAARKWLCRVDGPCVTVSPRASVTEDADKTGAFVECVIWVPKETL